MKDPTPPPPLAVSVVLNQLLATDRHLTVGEILDSVEERGFGLLMLVLGLPMLIPVLPPGASTIVGPIYAVLAVQLVAGVPRPWLPAWLRRKPLSLKTVEGLRQRGVPFVQRIERFSRPRFHILNNPVSVRLAAVIVFLMGIILLSPAPGMNTFPAIVVMLIGLALLNDDGFFLVTGIALGAVVIGVLIATIGLAIEFLQRYLPFW